MAGTQRRSIARRHLMARRLLCGMSRAQLAKYADMSPSTIKAIEYGLCMPKRFTMIRIADVLHFKWQKFYEEEGVEIP